MISNNNINFNNDTQYFNNNTNNSYNNCLTQNANQNTNNNFISSDMNVNNMRNNLNAFNFFNRFNPNMNYIANIPNNIFPYMNNMNYLYSPNNACIANPNYFFGNNNNLFTFKQEVPNWPNNDPNYSKILVNSLNDNIIDNKIENINNNVSSPIDLSINIIHVSPDEKEKTNKDRFYYHLCKFNTIEVEEIRSKLEKDNVDVETIEIIFNNMEKMKKENKKFYINKGLFYSNEKMSLYYPHIIKDNTKKNLASLFLPKDKNKLNIFDFQYSNITENDDIFILTLKKRIQEFNENKKTEDFGFFNNSFGIGYLYTKVPLDIIEDKLKSSNISNLKANLLGNISDKNNTYTENGLEYKIFKDNSKYLKGLTFEQIILNILMNGIEYEELPRLIFYEYFLTIKGERIVFLGENKLDYPGYNKLDYIFISKSNFIYEPELTGLNVLHSFEIQEKDIYKKDFSFSVKKGTLYFFELKSSLNNIDNYLEFIGKIINKANEFRALFINKRIITETTPCEIVIIYDDNIRNIFYDLRKDIFRLLRTNGQQKISIVYALQSYPFFSHSLNKKQIQNLKQEIEELKNRFEQLEKIIEDLKMSKNNDK